ncbi:hypothetical protein OHA70_17040 [Kribbella sp. NBC_00382]|uniref:hypothetical protein n=1 Tax=Kribbella sp. NBC_00382 TaxID=2975967 RepID=UPI002E1C62F3
MRKTIAATTAALILLGGAQLPAWAAGPEAPTGLQIGWVQPKHQQISITWADSGEANKVRVEYQGGGFVTLGARLAGTSNEYLKTGSLLDANRVARISVVSVDGSGVESAPVVSPWFDTIGAPLATFTKAAPLPDGSLKLDWSFAEVPADTTPADPLDVTPSEDYVNVVSDATPTAPRLSLVLPAGTSTVTLPPRPRPYPVSIRSSNEWVFGNNHPGIATVAFSEQTAGLTVPAVADYGLSLPFIAVAGVRLCANALVNCQDPANPFVAKPGIQALLQARPDATRPWKTIGTYKDQKLQFTASIRSYGGQEYRLSVPARSYVLAHELSVAPAISTSLRRVSTRARFTTAGFNLTTASVGQAVKATVSVQPAGTVKADLQWLDGKVWRHAGYVPLVKGTGTLSFKASGRGTTRSWRVVVPKMSMNGLPIVATASRAFKLTVR